MENKYYDIIIDLIKNHRKFSGLESVLDEIAQDVNEQAKDVLLSVTDEKVVQSYLVKIVSMSVIKFSKKLNLNKKSFSSKISARDLIENIERKEALNELYSQTSAEFFESSIKESRDENVSIEDNNVSINEQVDLTLVDKMINGVPQSDNENSSITEDDIEEESISLEESDTVVLEPENSVLEDEVVIVENTDDIIEIESEPEVVDDVDLEEYEAVYPEDVFALNIEEDKNSAEDNNVVKDFQAEEVLIDETFELVEENSSELVSNEFTTIEQEEKPVSLLIDEDAESSQVIDNIIECSVYDEFETIDNDSLSLDDNLILDESAGLDEGFEVIEEDNFLENVETFTAEEFSSNDVAFDYKKFDFVPDFDNLNNDLIISGLIELNSNKKDAHVLEICEMKFKKNLSIEEIAEHFDIESTTVLEILDEIIDAVKD